MLFWSIWLEYSTFIGEKNWFQNHYQNFTQGRKPVHIEEYIPVLLNLSHMKPGIWYKVVIENKVTMQSEPDGRRSLRPCKTDMKNSTVDWSISWSLANLKGLNPTEKTFLWRIMHNLLPTQARLFHHTQTVYSATELILLTLPILSLLVLSTQKCLHG